MTIESVGVLDRGREVIYDDGSGPEPGVLVGWEGRYLRVRFRDGVQTVAPSCTEFKTQGKTPVVA